MVQQLRFVTLDVFTHDRYAGNPLAVVLLDDSAGENGQDKDMSVVAAATAGEPDTDTLQRVAREFNLSETVFVYPARVNQEDGVWEWRVRIFLTTAEITFAGHPIIGATCYALQHFGPKGVLPQTRGRLLCPAGPIDVELLDSGSGAPITAVASIPHNIHLHTQHPLTPDAVLTRLQPAGLKPEDIVSADDDGGLAVVSPVRGMSFALIRLSSLEALARVRVGGGAAAPRDAVRLDAEWDVGFVGSYFYHVVGPREGGRDAAGPAPKGYEIRARMMEGSMEDPATGSAACALAGYLALREKRSLVLRVTQGVEMGRRSEIGVAVRVRGDGGAVERVELSGGAVPVMEGLVSI